MKLKLPSNTKELLKEPNETLDKIMTMMTQWENPTMSFHDTKEMEDQSEETKQIVLKIMCEMLGLPLRHVCVDDTCPYRSQNINTELKENLQDSRRDPTSRRTQISPREDDEVDSTHPPRYDNWWGQNQRTDGY